MFFSPRYEGRWVVGVVFVFVKYIKYQYIRVAFVYSPCSRFIRCNKQGSCERIHIENERRCPHNVSRNLTWVQCWQWRRAPGRASRPRGRFSRGLAVQLLNYWVTQRKEGESIAVSGKQCHRDLFDEGNCFHTVPIFCKTWTFGRLEYEEKFGVKCKGFEGELCMVPLHGWSPYILEIFAASKSAGARRIRRDLRR